MPVYFIATDLAQISMKRMQRAHKRVLCTGRTLFILQRLLGREHSGRTQYGDDCWDDKIAFRRAVGSVECKCSTDVARHSRICTQSRPRSTSTVLGQGDHALQRSGCRLRAARGLSESATRAQSSACTGNTHLATVSLASPATACRRPPDVRDNSAQRDDRQSLDH
jgi:hypothetical protein